MRFVRPALIAFALLGTVLLGSCNTPTLPIPPPITEALTGPDPDGNVEVKVTRDHDMEDAVYLLVLNQNTGHFSGDPRLPVTDDPVYAFVVQIAAARDDCLVAYFMIAPGEVGQGSERCIPWTPVP